MTKEQWLGALETRHGKRLQQRFSSASVAICGLGGLGSNVAICLARSGIGSLKLIDFDRVDLSNLNRQQYNISQLDMYKTEAMKNTLLGISPYCNITVNTVRLSENNLSLLGGCDIICECFDSPECKAMLVNGVSQLFPEKYIVAASGMSGLHTANTIKTKRFGKRLYICGDGKSDVDCDLTLFASRVMLCASHQANTVLRILAEKFDV